MDKQLSEKDREMLLNALENAKEMTRKMEAKQEEKRWSEFELPLSLAEALARLTKDELSAIRWNLDIKGASALKKQELTNVLVQQIPELLPHSLSKLDETRYRILKQIASHGGHSFVPLESHQYVYFKNRGLIFTGTYKGKQTLAMPQEVLACFNKMDTASYQTTIRRNTEWIRLTQGMLFFYGTLDISEIRDLFTLYTQTTLPMDDYIFVMEDSEPFYREIRLERNEFSYCRVWDAEKVKQEHQSRPDVSFYPFSKSQLLRAGVPGFVDRNPSHEAFVDFILRNYEITRDFADRLVAECAYGIRLGESPSDLLEFLQSQLEIDEFELVEAFMNFLVVLNNKTRQWFLKGYTPNELSPMKKLPNNSLLPAKAEVFEFATRKKVGRNDPCPCGSGKKFKKCCGG